jgi:hypothetical protein
VVSRGQDFAGFRFKLGFFALIQPDGDILPGRTIYGDGHAGEQTNIGLNSLTSAKPLWFAGPDVVGSLRLSRKMPKILRAIQFEPEGGQDWPSALRTRFVSYSSTLLGFVDFRG